MLTIRNTSRDPFYNQALEDYVYHHFTEDDVFLLWQNTPCVIVGSFQNISREVDILALEKERIPVVRRITGGGTVYHDEGNFNYALILNHEKELDYDRCLEPMLTALHQLGIKAYKNRVCDIALEGGKISGSAQRVEKGRILHHGTLLFQSDLGKLNAITTKNKNRYIVSKATESAICEVTNITHHMAEPVDAESFSAALRQIIVPHTANQRVLGEAAQKEILALVQEKYRSWEWTWGRTPAFRYERDGLFRGKPVHVRYEAKKGRIVEAVLHADFWPQSETACLVGCPIDPEHLRAACRRLAGKDAEELVQLLV